MLGIARKRMGATRAALAWELRSAWCETRTVSGTPLCGGAAFRPFLFSGPAPSAQANRSAVESSKDAERWRFLGKGWTAPGEPLLIHGASQYLRFRRLDPEEAEWTVALERTGDQPIALLDLSAGQRRDIWPSEEHLGLPVLLPGGEEGRLLRFEHSADGAGWTWALEFRGERPVSR
jgi:hypothetical protein